MTTTPSLSKIQRAILTHAAEQAEGVCLPPNRARQRAARESAADLLTLKLIRTVRAKDGTPTWYVDDAGRPVSLIVTKRGRDAIRVPIRTAAAPMAAPSDKQVARGPTRVGEPPREGSKIAQVIKRLSQEAGASLPELIQLTGWLPHTTRAAMTGLRKRGYTVALERGENNAPVYRVTSAPAQTEAG